MSPALIWLVVAAGLGLAELIVPGVFLVFLAVAAAITGATLFAAPALPLIAQLGSFVGWSVITVLIGRRWYHEYPVPSADPLLNDRAARMIGQVVTVTDPIVGGHGRVRVGDGEWPARGPDSETGTRLKIAAVAHGTVVLEALD